MSLGEAPDFPQLMQVRERVNVFERDLQKLVDELHSTDAADLREWLADVHANLQRLQAPLVLVIAGTGNSGKSTMCNRLLGWEVAPYADWALTSRICEMQYGEQLQYQVTPTSPMEELGAEGLPDESAHVSSQADHNEFLRLLKTPLRCWLQAPLLKAGVRLVDLPGFNQEAEYKERIQDYTKDIPEDDVVVCYMLRITEKVCGSDREFFSVLSTTKWASVLPRLLVAVNIKCNAFDAGVKRPMPVARLFEDIQRQLHDYHVTNIVALSVLDGERVPEELRFQHAFSGSLDSALSGRLRNKVTQDTLPLVKRGLQLINIRLQDAAAKAQVLYQAEVELQAQKAARDKIHGSRGVLAKEVQDEFVQGFQRDVAHLQDLAARHFSSIDAIKSKESIESLKKRMAEFLLPICVKIAVLAVEGSKTFNEAHEAWMLDLNAEAKKAIFEVMWYNLWHVIASIFCRMMNLFGLVDAAKDLWNWMRGNRIEKEDVLQAFTEVSANLIARAPEIAAQAAEQVARDHDSRVGKAERHLEQLRRAVEGDYKFSASTIGQYVAVLQNFTARFHAFQEAFATSTQETRHFRRLP